MVGRRLPPWHICPRRVGIRRKIELTSDFTIDMFHQIAQEVGKLAAMNRRKTIKKDDIKFA